MSQDKRSLCILQISSHFYPKIDGTVRSIEALISGLQQRGHIVFLVTRKMAGTPFIEHLRGVKVVRVGPSGKSLFSRLLLGLNQALITMTLLRRKRVDLIDTHGFSSMIAGFILKQIYHIPLILSFHGIPRLWARNFRWRKWHEAFLSYPLERFLIKRATRIVVWSFIDATRVASLYGSDVTRKIFVVPRVVDTQTFTYAQPRTTDRYTVLFVGTLSRIHGVELLIRAAPIVLKEIPKAKFVLVGSGPLKPHLEKLTRDLEIEKSVVFAGLIKNPQEVASFYKMSDVVVVPAQYTGGFPNVVAEALATGRPVITTLALDRNLTDIGVFFVDKWDSRDLAEAIKQVLLDEELASASALRARKFVEENYSKQTYISTLERVYQDLVSNR